MHHSRKRHFCHPRRPSCFRAGSNGSGELEGLGGMLRMCSRLDMVKVALVRSDVIELL